MPGVGAPWTVNMLYFLPVQAVVARVLYECALTAARGADTESAGRAAAAVDLEVATARAAAEREHWAVLHDTAAATLLMVGGGVPKDAHPLVRRQARRDLAALDAEPCTPNLPAHRSVRLMAGLRRIAAETSLSVEFTGPMRQLVPEAAAHAIIGAVGELLTNVARHAGVRQAQINLRAAPELLEVTVSDRGIGFTPTSMLGRGLRESVIARTERIGGQVTITSAPGHGTTASLRWLPT